jgi:hypothetical protein
VAGCEAVLPEQLGEVVTGLLVTLAMRRVAVATTQVASPVIEDLRGLDHVALGPAMTATISRTRRQRWRSASRTSAHNRGRTRVRSAA